MVAKIVTERLLKRMEKGTLPWRKNWKGGPPANYVSQRRYTGVNFLLLSSSPGSRWWLTYRQLKELGGKLRPHAVPFIVVFFKEYTKKEECEEGKKEKKIRVMRYYHVFNLADVEGIVAPENRAAPGKPTVSSLLAGFDDPPEVRIVPGARRCYYSPLKHEVVVPPQEEFTSPSAFYGALLHELAHATAPQLGRELPKAEEELVAELAACIAAARLNLKVKYPDSAAYLNSWINSMKKKPGFILKMAGAAEKAASIIASGPGPLSS